MVKNLPAMQETQETRVCSLCQGDPLEEGMASHSSILAWRIPWTEEPGRLQSIGSQRVGHDGARTQAPIFLCPEPPKPQIKSYVHCMLISEKIKMVKKIDNFKNMTVAHS